MAKKLTIDIVTRLQDNGDGGWTVNCYNNAEEMLADHRLAVDGKVSEEDRESILNEDDPYENGYIGRKTIEIEIGEDGKARLAKPICIHAGQ